MRATASEQFCVGSEVATLTDMCRESGPLEALDARIWMANFVRSRLGLNIILTFIVNWTK